MAVILEQTIIDILVKKITSKEINPKTNEPFKLNDIKISEYKTAVENALNIPT